MKSKLEKLNKPVYLRKSLGSISKNY